jgi:hypothetical protein
MIASLTVMKDAVAQNIGKLRAIFDLADIFVDK